MIVKNEAEQLGACIASVRDFVDEICIVDTGSEDGTLEMAREAGARTEVFLWCDDFAAARNESLRLCSKDWVFVLDADERIDAQDLEKLKALVRGPHERAYRFTTRNYTNSQTVSDFQPAPAGDPHAQGFAGWFPSVKVRLFPNRAGIQFEGKVHELVEPSVQRLGLQVADCDVPVHHYAMLRPSEQIRKKQELYLQLGHEKLKSEASNPKALCELGNQYHEAGDIAQAAGAYREALRQDPTMASVWKDLGGMLYLLKRHDEAKRALHIALDLDPEIADAWRNLGVVHVDQKEFENAIECFEKGISLRPQWTDGYRYLATALEGADRLSDAVKASRKALEANPHSKESLKLYIHQMLRLERRSQARQTLLKLIEGGEALPELENAVGELFFYDDLLEESKDLFRKAGEHGLAAAYNNLGVVLFKQGLLAEAREAFEACLAEDPSHRGARNNLSKVMQNLGEDAG